MRRILQPSLGRNGSSGFGPDGSPCPTGAENPGNLADVCAFGKCYVTIQLF